MKDYQFFTNKENNLNKLIMNTLFLMMIKAVKILLIYRDC